MTEAVRRERVTGRAAFDLDCREGVEVVKIDVNAYGAIGCGRRASYVMEYCHDGGWPNHCRLLLEGTTGEGAVVPAAAAAE